MAEKGSCINNLIIVNMSAPFCAGFHLCKSGIRRAHNIIGFNTKGATGRRQKHTTPKYEWGACPGPPLLSVLLKQEGVKVSMKFMCFVPRLCIFL